MVQLLLDAVAASDPGALFMYRKATLIYAAITGQLVILRHLLLDLVDVDRRDPLWSDVFYEAALYSRLDALRMLFKHGTHPGRTGQVMLLSAEQNRHDDVVELLIENHVPENDPAEIASFMCKIVRWGRLSTVNRLIAAGYPADIPDPTSGRTPLSFAAQRSNIAMMRVLIKAGADPLVHYHNGWMPLG
ncbi:ankyrin [Aspergillus campestris IBT 28561]|uniref:Ankyrin n=1 Tax=Aspergillus campestris (strain IBT 28561) TaxID=1392248 RepID=A0A2I1D8E0_ASPC2|nr:ankyrin [Aspergillus campestris IBT 28561]PKY06153.1 ankyrin [Aspergillus campestris IBT 28561]